MKRFNYFLGLIAVLLLFPSSVWGKTKVITRSESKPPQWLSHKPKPTNPSFIYIDVLGIGESLEQAKANCFTQLANNEDLKSTVELTVDRKSVKEVNQERLNGVLTEQIKTTEKVTLEAHGKQISVTANLVDSYWELVEVGNRTEYRCRCLYAVAVSPLPPLFDNVTFSCKYGAHGFWRSLIVPGWGQMYKGSTGKGIAILSTEVAAVVGIAVSENLRASYIKKIKEQPQHYKVYNSKADDCENVRNGFIVGAAAVYIYNLVDAIVANGAKRTIIKKNTAFRLSPVAYEYGGVGVSAVYKF